jgi:signal peptidase I
VKLQDNNVYIKDQNGKYQLLKENYLPAKTFHYGDERIFKIPAGHYFVLGDNRPNSLDSRRFGPISKEQITGRVFFRGWPFDQITVFKTPQFDSTSTTTTLK